jgi:putative colanic acid biosynthesis UDP-glucose lipid carrier transferase
VKTGLLRQYEDVVHATQRLADLFLVAGAHVFMTWEYGQIWRPQSSSATAVAVLAFSVAAELCSLYRPWRVERLKVEIRTVFLAWSMTVATLVLLAFATKTSEDYSRVVSFGWFAVSLVALCGWRFLVRFVLRATRANGKNIRRVAILGATPGARDLCEQIEERPWMGIRVQGVYDDRGSDRREDLLNAGCPFLGTTRELVRACRDGRVDIVYVALPLRAELRILQAMEELADTTATVYLVADFFQYHQMAPQFTALGRMSLISLHDTPFHGISGLAKRLEDIVIGSAILLGISLPLLVIALLVKVTSRGPVLFRQRRYGLNGAEIRILKFRTMTVCEDGPNIAQAQKNDPRVTPLGRFLRRTSLDELPQFLQVVTGQMSIVGPRPHAVAHNESYRRVIPSYMLRHKVKPGITGWAQVNGWRGETPEVALMQKRVEHDLEYIGRWTLLWDIKIILMTMMGRKKSQNAY